MTHEELSEAITRILTLKKQIRGHRLEVERIEENKPRASDSDYYNGALRAGFIETYKRHEIRLKSLYEDERRLEKALQSEEAQIVEYIPIALRENAILVTVDEKAFTFKVTEEGELAVPLS